MVLPMLALAKLNLLSQPRSLSPFVSSLVLPFLLKLSFSFPLVTRNCVGVVDASRLFFFQLGQIAFGSADQSAFGGGSRLERALRLVHRSRSHARRPQAPQIEDDSLHALSMFVL
ncbi:hypothetical protein FH972_012714 [Carpinus fangiana]|uniref:Uncharacterized protein n=1 Tax=Carpinus fangiana TaxID=176857 RepID=A0A5N6R671_9ROSI|nr:hypothetical protein FH972_012714 [Carpinus fangiana]